MRRQSTNKRDDRSPKRPKLLSDVVSVDDELGTGATSAPPAVTGAIGTDRDSPIPHQAAENVQTSDVAMEQAEMPPNTEGREFSSTSSATDLGTWASVPDEMPEINFMTRSTGPQPELRAAKKKADLGSTPSCYTNTDLETTDSTSDEDMKFLIRNLGPQPKSQVAEDPAEPKKLNRQWVWRSGGLDSCESRDDIPSSTTTTSGDWGPLPGSPMAEGSSLSDIALDRMVFNDNANDVVDENVLMAGEESGHATNMDCSEMDFSMSGARVTGNAAAVRNVETGGGVVEEGVVEEGVVEEGVVEEGVVEEGVVEEGVVEDDNVKASMRTSRESEKDQ